MMGIIGIIGTFLASTLFTSAVFLYFIFNPAEFQKWCSMIFWACSKVWKGASYWAIKYDIQSGINSFVESLNSRTTANFPRVAIRWAGKDKEEIIWEEGKLLLVMRDKNHKTKNFVHASYLFVSEMLLRKSKAHLSKSQKLSLDLFATKQILERENPAALEQFMGGYFAPQVAGEDKVRAFVGQYINISKVGMFFPVLIQELTFLGNTIFLQKPSTEIINEVNSLIDFLEKFANREVGDNSNPETFAGKHIRCAIRIIASRAVREAHRIEGRRQRLISWIKAGYPNIYIIGSSSTDNNNFTSDVIEAVQADYPDLQVVKTYKYKSRIKFREGEKVVSNALTHLHYPNAVKYILSEAELTQP